MKLFISLLFVTTYTFAKSPIMIYWNGSLQTMKELENVLVRQLQIPNQLINNTYKENPCEKTGDRKSVLVLCLENQDLKIIYKDKEALNNTYRVFRNL